MLTSLASEEDQLHLSASPAEDRRRDRLAVEHLGLDLPVADEDAAAEALHTKALQSGCAVLVTSWQKLGLTEEHRRVIRVYKGGGHKGGGAAALLADYPEYFELRNGEWWPIGDEHWPVFSDTDTSSESAEILHNSRVSRDGLSVEAVLGAMGDFARFLEDALEAPPEPKPADVKLVDEFLASMRASSKSLKNLDEMKAARILIALQQRSGVKLPRFDICGYTRLLIVARLAGKSRHLFTASHHAHGKDAAIPCLRSV